MSGIQHEYTLNAVTAAAFYKSRDGQSFVLVGEGCFLKVFEAETSKLAAQCKIFSAQTIHGIIVFDSASHINKIASIIWGGTSFVLLSTENLEAIVIGDVESVTTYESSSPDWILDGTISPNQDSAVCIFVTAHSAILRVCESGNSRKNILTSFQSQSRSVLYSAHAAWTSSNSFLVAGGTVFGEIEVTAWQKMSNDNFHSHQIHFFDGHEGSVFGVRISPEVISQDGNPARYLASCSDDRTIRLWEIPMPMEDESTLNLKLERSSEIRETGFGDNDSGFTKESSPKKCLAVVMAHASRIWHVEFIVWDSTLKGYDKKLHLLSFGEDSTCQQWSVDFFNMKSEQESSIFHNTAALEIAQSSKRSAVLTHLKTFSYHSGKHIWSTAISYVSIAARRLATGGADGKVAVYDVFLEVSAERPISFKRSNNEKTSSLQKITSAATRSWTLQDMSRKMNPANRDSNDIPLNMRDHPEISGLSISTNITVEPTDKKKGQVAKDVPNRYGFVGKNEFLVTTSLGRIILTSIDESFLWEDLDTPDKVRNDLNSYSILLGVPRFAVALMAGANGLVYIYHKRVVTELLKIQGKPAAFFDISSERNQLLDILVTCVGSEIAYQISIMTSGEEPYHLESLGTIKLPPSFVVTGAGKISGLIILGARNGSMAVYDLQSSRDATKVITGKEAQIEDAITTILTLPLLSTQESRAHFLTTNRNGSYSIFHISMTQDSEKIPMNVSIQLVHQVFPPLGPMIEAAWFIESDLFLYGFRSKNFIVWNETKQCEVTSVECGGAHRSYAYMHSSGTGGAGNFAYTKASKLRIHSQAQPSHRVLKSGGHGREIKTAAIHKDFIATGAEDTVIRIWRIHRDGTSTPSTLISVDSESGKHGNISMEYCAVLEKHTTGIQHLHWSCSTEEYHSLFSAGGSEEFHVWAVSDIPGFGVGVVREATLTDFSEDRDLRIMGFDVNFIPDRRPRRVTHGESSTLLGKNEIVLVYSDSTIKLYEYSKSGGFEKTAQGVYTSACLTQVVFVRESQGLRKFFTAATDGYLALWECPPRRISSAELSGTSTLTKDFLNFLPLEPKLILRIKLHQSSISALAIQHLTLISQPGGLLVATAGDDNALCITFLHDFSPKKRVIIPSAHAAGITGLTFKSDVTGGVAEDKWCQLWTVGGDQRVKRWTIEFGHEQEDPKPTMQNALNMRVWSQEDGDDAWCSIADPGGLVEWRDNWEEDCVLIYGNGMEVFKLQDGFPNGDGTRWAGFIKEEPKQTWSDDEDYDEE